MDIQQKLVIFVKSDRMVDGGGKLEYGGDGVGVGIIHIR